jgi:hypothetical protein
MLFGALNAWYRQLIDLTQAFRDKPRKDLIANVVVPYIDHLLGSMATVLKFEEDIERKTPLVECPRMKMRPSTSMSVWLRRRA